MSLPQLPVGGKILQGRYQVSETGEIGRGQFGVVYEVEEAHTGLKFAAKFLDVRGPSEAQARRELDVIEAVRKVGGHQNLIRVKEVGDDWGCPVVIMELAQESLADWDRRVRGQNLDDGARRRRLTFFTQQVADGLDFLGFYHLVHHDVKPGNVVLVGGVAKLTDFGLSKPLTPPVTEQSIGWTPLYAAPEFLQGEGGSRPYTSDQYSLAVTYHLLRTGHLPFKKWRDAGAVKKATTAELILAHVENAIDVSSLGPNEGAAVARALAKQPEDRFPSCREFAEAVANGVETDSWKPAQQAVRRTAIKPGVWAAGGLVVVLLAVLAGLLVPLLGGGTGGPPPPSGFARDEEVAALRQVVERQRRDLLILDGQVDALRSDYPTLFAAAWKAANRGEYASARELLAQTREKDRDFEFDYLERRLRRCDADATLIAWQGLSHPDRQPGTGTSEIVQNVLFHPKGDGLVSLSGRGTVVFHPIEFGQHRPLDGSHLDACLNPQGTQLVTVGVDGVTRAWQVGGGAVTLAGVVNELKPARKTDPHFTTAAFGRDGEVLYIGTSTGEVWVHDVKAKYKLQHKLSFFGETKSPVTGVLEIERGNGLGWGDKPPAFDVVAASSQERGNGLKWQPDDPFLATTVDADLNLPPNVAVRRIAPSHDRGLLTALTDDTIHIYGFNRRHFYRYSVDQLRCFPSHGRAVHLTFAGRNRLFVRFERGVVLVHLLSGRVLLTLESQPAPVGVDVEGSGGLSWDKQNLRLASGWGHSVSLWEFAKEVEGKK